MSITLAKESARKWFRCDQYLLNTADKSVVVDLASRSWDWMSAKSEAKKLF